MLAETFPLIVKVVRKRKATLLLLVVLSALAGFLPTMKSQVESFFVNGVTAYFSSQDELPEGAERKAGGPFDAFAEALMDERQVQRLEKRSDDADLTEKIAFDVLRDASRLQALLMYVLLAFLAYLLSLFAKILTSEFRQSVFRALCDEGYRKGLLIHAWEGQPRRNVAGHHAQAIQRGAENVANSYEYILEACQTLFGLVVVFSLIISKSVFFTVVCFSLVLVLSVVSLIQARRLRSRRNQFDSARNELLAASDDILDKREIILAHEQTARYADELGKLSGGYASINRQLVVSEERYRGIGRALADVGQASILGAVLVAAYWMKEGTVVGVGGVVFFVTIYGRMLSPTRQLLWRYDSLMRAQATSKVFLGLLRAKPRAIVEGVSEESPVEDGDVAVSLSEVSYSYPGDGEETRVLRSCSLRIPKDRTTMILGPSGCGKTTIARMLLGFLPPDSGTIRILGQDSKSLSLDQILKQMSYVSQESFVVDDTVRNNLLWASEEKQLTDSDLLGALQSLKVVGSDEDPSFLDKRAHELSTGQKQRLCLARILLDRAPIVILDEPLSGIDVFTLRVVLPVLARHLAGQERTFLIFSHQLALLELADHVVILDSGAGVAEEGQPVDLLATSGSILTSLAEVDRRHVILDPHSQGSYGGGAEGDGEETESNAPPRSARMMRSLVPESKNEDISSRQPIIIINSSRQTVARAEVSENDGLHSGDIDLEPMPAALRRQFEEFEEAVNDQALLMVNEIQGKIQDLGLEGVLEDGRSLRLTDLQVYPSTQKVSFKVLD